MAVIFRNREDLESQRLAAIDDVASSPNNQRSHGVLAGLDWALGFTPTAPVTGRRISQITLDDIRSEHDAVDEVVSRRREPASGYSLDWYGGLDQTLLWLISDTTPRPMTAGGEVFLKPKAVIAEALSMLRDRQRSPEITTGEAAQLKGAVKAMAWVLGEGRSPVTDSPPVAGGIHPTQVDEEAERSSNIRFETTTPQGDMWLYLCAADDALSWMLDETSFAFRL